MTPARSEPNPAPACAARTARHPARRRQLVGPRRRGRAAGSWPTCGGPGARHRLRARAAWSSRWPSAGSRRSASTPSPAAVGHAIERQATALVRSVFDPLPGTGRWATALLFDGNVGIGGDPARLLRRVRRAARPDGRAIVEMAPPGSGDPLVPGPGASEAPTDPPGSRGREVGVDAIARPRRRRRAAPSTDARGRRPMVRRARAVGRHDLPPSTRDRRRLRPGPDGRRGTGRPPRHPDRRRPRHARSGIAFTICFVTGLISHLIQHPPSWFTWPTRPAGLYRVTQGLHIATGMASIPLARRQALGGGPPVLGPAGRARRRRTAWSGSSCSRWSAAACSSWSPARLNTFKWYPWGFFFPRAHYWAAWVTIGGLVAHIGAKAALTWRVAAARATRPRRRAARAGARRPDRRWFLGGVGLGAGALTVATVGQTFRPLRGVSVLAPRDPGGRAAGHPDQPDRPSARVTPSLGRCAGPCGCRAGSTRSSSSPSPRSRPCPSTRPRCPSPASRGGAPRPRGRASACATCSNWPGPSPTGRCSCSPSRLAASTGRRWSRPTSPPTPTRCSPSSSTASRWRSITATRAG